MIILRVRKVGDYYEAVEGDVVYNAKVRFGGEFNVGGVDGLDASAVIQAAIKEADVIHAELLDVKKRDREVKK